MSKQFLTFEEIKAQKETFVNSFVEEFDKWYEQNKDNKNHPTLDQVQELMFGQSK